LNIGLLKNPEKFPGGLSQRISLLLAEDENTRNDPQALVRSNCGKILLCFNFQTMLFPEVTESGVQK